MKIPDLLSPKDVMIDVRGSNKQLLLQEFAAANKLTDVKPIDGAIALRLNEMASPAVSHTLHVEFERNGRLIATEDFILAQGVSGDLEILARRPALLETAPATSVTAQPAAAEPATVS